MKPRVLIVDDDPTVVRFLTAACASHASSVEHATHPAELITKIAGGIDLVFLDLMMPELDGVDLLREFAGESAAFPPVVLVSGLHRSILDTSLALARRLGFRVHGALSKPISLADVDGLFAASAHERRVTGAYSLQYSREAVQEALRDKQLHLVYQPQIRLHDGRICGVEALVRWRHPTHGEISPLAFVPVLEASGLSTELAFYVLDRALEEMHVWQRPDESISLSVNIGAEVLRQQGFANDVLDRVRRKGFSPGTLCLEVTESAIVTDDVVTLQSLVRLRMQGVRFSIDDFGTGHSTLAQLRKLPVTEIKLDRSYVKQLAESTKSRAIVAGMLKIAEGVGAEVVAEGVEDDEVASVLRELECAIAQGYHYSRPIGAEALREWIAARG